MSVGWPPSYVRDRVETFAAAVLVVLAALAGHLLLGQQVTSADNTGGPLRLAAIGSLCVALALLWLPIRALLRKRVRLSARTLVLAAVVVSAGAIIAWVAIGYSGTLESFRGGIGHGRIHYWSVAVQTWLHRPLIGSGANTFLPSLSAIPGDRRRHAVRPVTCHWSLRSSSASWACYSVRPSMGPRSAPSNAHGHPPVFGCLPPWS